jgi:ABC-type multidrug transport system fused ATPase/permease subunit
MFEPITRFDEYVKPQDKNKLFKNILLSFKSSFIVGMVVSIIYASFNLMLPQIIKEFMEIMQSPKSEIILASSYITEKFIILQILRMIFGNHMKRLFVELAIKIESTLSRKLIKKALMMDDNCRKRIPESEIYQLENVDLKLVNLLFSNFYNAFEIPFTIIVALVLLFIQDIKYGFIGLYWFLIIFFVQRALDDKMTHCNLTKLSLIDKRSKVNYEIM